MTTVELVQHLLMVSRVAIGPRTPAQDQELALVMTQAVADFYALAPACHRRTTLSEHRPAASTVSVTVVNGSATVTGTPFTPNQRGCSLEFPDGSWNEIVDTDRLLKHASQASGTYSCTVHYDALAFDDFQIERILTDPEVETPSGGINHVLATWTPSGARAAHRPLRLADITYCAEASRRRERALVPLHYWAEYVGGSIAAANDALFQLRFWPIPTVEYHITFDAEVLPDTYRISSVDTPATLPVPDAIAQRILVPLARGRLARTPLFDPERADKIDLLDARAEAMEETRNLTPLFAPRPAFAFTPVGW